MLTFFALATGHSTLRGSEEAGRGEQQVLSPVSDNAEAEALAGAEQQRFADSSLETSALTTTGQGASVGFVDFGVTTAMVVGANIAASMYLSSMDTKIMAMTTATQDEAASLSAFSQEFLTATTSALETTLSGVKEAFVGAKEEIAALFVNSLPSETLLDFCEDLLKANAGNALASAERLKVALTEVKRTGAKQYQPSLVRVISANSKGVSQSRGTHADPTALSSTVDSSASASPSLKKLRREVIHLARLQFREELNSLYSLYSPGNPLAREGKRLANVKALSGGDHASAEPFTPFKVFGAPPPPPSSESLSASASVVGSGAGGDHSINSANGAGGAGSARSSGSGGSVEIMNALLAAENRYSFGRLVSDARKATSIQPPVVELIEKHADSEEEWSFALMMDSNVDPALGGMGSLRGPEQVDPAALGPSEPGSLGTGFDVSNGMVGSGTLASLTDDSVSEMTGNLLGLGQPLISLALSPFQAGSRKSKLKNFPTESLIALGLASEQAQSAAVVGRFSTCQLLKLVQRQLKKWMRSGKEHSKYAEHRLQKLAIKEALEMSRFGLATPSSINKELMGATDEKEVLKNSDIRKTLTLFLGPLKQLQEGHKHSLPESALLQLYRGALANLCGFSLPLYRKIDSLFRANKGLCRPILQEFPTLPPRYDVSSSSADSLGGGNGRSSSSSIVSSSSTQLGRGSITSSASTVMGHANSGLSTSASTAGSVHLGKSGLSVHEEAADEHISITVPRSFIESLKPQASLLSSSSKAAHVAARVTMARITAALPENGNEAHSPTTVTIKTRCKHGDIVDLRVTTANDDTRIGQWAARGYKAPSDTYSIPPSSSTPKVAENLAASAGSAGFAKVPLKGDAALPLKSLQMPTGAFPASPADRPAEATLMASASDSSSVRRLMILRCEDLKAQVEQAVIKAKNEAPPAYGQPVPVVTRPVPGAAGGASGLQKAGTVANNNNNAPPQQKDFRGAIDLLTKPKSVARNEALASAGISGNNALVAANKLFGRGTVIRPQLRELAEDKLNAYYARFFLDLALNQAPISGVSLDVKDAASSASPPLLLQDSPLDVVSEALELNDLTSISSPDQRGVEATFGLDAGLVMRVTRGDALPLKDLLLIPFEPAVVPASLKLSEDGTATVPTEPSKANSGSLARSNSVITTNSNSNNGAGNNQGRRWITLAESSLLVNQRAAMQKWGAAMSTVQNGLAAAASKPKPLSINNNNVNGGGGVSGSGSRPNHHHSVHNTIPLSASNEKSELTLAVEALEKARVEGDTFLTDLAAPPNCRIVQRIYRKEKRQSIVRKGGSYYFFSTKDSVSIETEVRPSHTFELSCVLSPEAQAASGVSVDRRTPQQKRLLAEEMQTVWERLPTSLWSNGDGTPVSQSTTNSAVSAAAPYIWVKRVLALSHPSSRKTSSSSSSPSSATAAATSRTGDLFEDIKTLREADEEADEANGIENGDESSSLSCPASSASSSAFYVIATEGAGSNNNRPEDIARQRTAGLDERRLGLARKSNAISA